MPEAQIKQCHLTPSPILGSQLFGQASAESCALQVPTSALLPLYVPPSAPPRIVQYMLEPTGKSCSRRCPPAARSHRTASASGPGAGGGGPTPAPPQPGSVVMMIIMMVIMIMMMILMVMMSVMTMMILMIMMTVTTMTTISTMTMSSK